PSSGPGAPAPARPDRPGLAAGPVRAPTLRARALGAAAAVVAVAAEGAVDLSGHPLYYDRLLLVGLRLGQRAALHVRRQLVVRVRDQCVDHLLHVDALRLRDRRDRLAALQSRLEPRL